MSKIDPSEKITDPSSRIQSVLRDIRQVVGEETVSSMMAPYAKPFVVDPRLACPSFDPPVDERNRKRKKSPGVRKDKF